MKGKGKALSQWIATRVWHGHLPQQRYLDVYSTASSCFPNNTSNCLPNGYLMWGSNLCHTGSYTETTQDKLLCFPMPPWHWESIWYHRGTSIDTYIVPYVGVNGKTWRLVKNWYSNWKASIWVGNTLSPHFQPKCGIQQAKVCPLANLLPAGNGPNATKIATVHATVNVANLFPGAAAHAQMMWE